MRLWSYVRWMLAFTIFVIAGALAAAAVGLVQSPPTLPAWTIAPFLFSILLPTGFTMILKMRKINFRVPIPDPDLPERTRASWRILALLVLLVLVPAGALIGLSFGAPAETNMALYLIPGLSVTLVLMPWVRLFFWLRKTETALIIKYSDLEDEDEENEDPPAESGP